MLFIIQFWKLRFFANVAQFDRNFKNQTFNAQSTQLKVVMGNTNVVMMELGTSMC